MTLVDRRTRKGEMATTVVLSIFRVNGLLLAAGDQLAGQEGLTSARWQVMGAIQLSERPLTMPQIARRMGLTRQTVHTTVTNLVREGLAELIPNPDHARSQLVSLTTTGRRKYDAIDRRQAAWINELVDASSLRDLEAAARFLDGLCAGLDSNGALGAAGMEGGAR
jgi:DNA-binding MarR family transcriptional regulator